MAGPRQAFPLTADEEMADAPAGLGLVGPVGSSGMSSREQAAMADLEQALGLAAAWFGGDESAARWAAGGAGGSGGASAPGSPAGVLPSDDPFDARGQGPQWRGEAGWAVDDAEQDALLGLPSAQQAQHEDPLGLEADRQLASLDDGLSSLLGSAPLEAGIDDTDAAAEQPAGGQPSSSGAATGQRAAVGAGSPAEASSVARELGSMQLDDIDAEPADAVAPGGGPLSLEAALAAGPAESEPAPPPIEPAPTDLAAAEEDPLAALAAAVEADKPKFRPSPEWLKMMKSVEAELDGAVQQGAALMEGAAPPGSTAQERQEAAAVAGVVVAHQGAASGTQGMQVAAADDEEMPSAADAVFAYPNPAEGAQQPAADAQELDPLAADSQPAAVSASPDQDRQRAFALLQPICSMLLLQRAEPQRMAELLRALEAALQEAPQAGLQQCMDYVLFPLLMMLDAAAALRQARGSSGSSSEGGQRAGSAAPPEGAAGALMALPAMSSDRAVEAALGCMRALLQRCAFQAGEGLLGVLRRLAAMLALPEGATSEEVREQALLCVDAAAAGVLRREAPLAVRQALLSEESAPLLGYLSSLLLQLAEAEAQRGSSGRAVRDAALQALLHLLTAVAGRQQQEAAASASSSSILNSATSALALEEAQPAAEALAFFLPGIAVGLCKALLLAAASSGSTGGGRGPTGPAASSAAAVSAIRALAVLLVACLGNAAVEAALHGAAPGSSVGAGTGSGSVDAWSLGQAGGDVDMADAEAAGTAGGDSESLRQALQQLQQLAQRTKSGAAGSSGTAPAASSQPQQQQAKAPPQQPLQPGSRMRVERSTEWVQDSAERLHQLLSTALPPLLTHQRPAVREALVQACCRLLDSCSMALQPRTQEVLLQLLLSAAQDEWQQVSAPARTWLQRQAEAAAAAPPMAASSATALSAFAAASERLLLQLLDGLPGALRSSDAAGRQHAQQLTSAIQVCPPAWFAANVVHHPVRLQQLASAFLEAFAFDASIAGMLLYAGVLPAGAATRYAAGAAGGAAAAPAGAAAGAAGAANGDVTQQAQQGQQQVAAQGSAGSGSVVLLPRMPLGLVLVTTAATYEAVSSALRAAAALAAAADAAPGGSGTTLRRLVDAFLGRLQQVVEAGAASSDSGDGRTRAHKRSRQRQHQGQQDVAGKRGEVGELDIGGQLPWQLQAASVAAVLAELLLGASPAWQPSWHPAGSSGSSGGGSIAGTSSSGSSGGSGSRELELLAAAVVQELVQEGIWSLPTSVQQPASPGPTAAGSPTLLLDAAAAPHEQRITAQQLGCNALLLRAALECCGAAARALGPRFAQNGRLLRTTLLPLLDKLADGAQLVSSAAQAAVGSVCWCCGYGGSLRRLVAANADYVVDGMCAQLRQLEAHPRAPQLFSALLQQAGVAPELLPLLVEPARSAIQGVGILARRQQPQHVLAFLQALSPVAAAAGAVARQVLAEMRQAAQAVQERWEARQKQLEEEEATAAAASGGSAAATQDDIRRYFQRRQRQQERAAAAAGAAALGEEGEAEADAAEEMEREEEERKVPLSGTEREHVSLLRRHAAAAAGLAQAAADAASPLAMSQSLQVAVQSFGVCTEALRALAATTEAVELETDKIQVLTRRRTEVAGPDPEAPRMLPSVHLAWAPLMGALQDWRVSVVESALQFLADCACLAGSFLRKRFAQEALPQLQRLLRDGPARRNIIAPGQDDTTSPATVQRAQLAVLRCLHQIASCRDQLAIAGVSSSASEALVPSAHLLLAAVGDMMGSRQAAPVREQATQTYIALARIDPDAAWCQLSAALVAAGGAPLPSSASSATEPPASEQPRVPPGLALKSDDGTPLAFPPQTAIAPPLPTAAAAGPTRAAAAGAAPARRRAEAALPAMTVPPGLRECGAAKLAAMLRQVEQLPPQWHKQVEALLARP
ncbi:hypothetical protein ABPG75_003080 [Micractinium tetrahymenae]